MVRRIASAAERRGAGIIDALYHPFQYFVKDSEQPFTSALFLYSVCMAHPANVGSGMRPTQKSSVIVFLREWAYSAREFFYQLLRIDAVRQFVAWTRFVYFVYILRRLRTLDPQTGDIGVNTVRHNLISLRKTSGLNVPRSNLLIYPLSAIRMSKATPILSIGPRSEGELLNFRALGFKNVRGLDLISYSPWIDLGDMHAMPYADKTFGAVVLGWVIAYSDNRRKAAQEIIRVVRDGGFVAIGVEYSKESAEATAQRVGYDMCDKEKIESVQQILDIFSPYVDRVLFSHDVPRSDVAFDKWQLLVIFSIKKSNL